MEDYFRELSDTLCAGLAAGEVLLLNFRGESSDFARLNHNRIQDISPITSLPRLSSVGLAHNRITDVSKLPPGQSVRPIEP